MKHGFVLQFFETYDQSTPQRMIVHFHYFIKKSLKLEIEI